MSSARKRSFLCWVVMMHYGLWSPSLLFFPDGKCIVLTIGCNFFAESGSNGRYSTFSTMLVHNVSKFTSVIGAESSSMTGQRQSWLSLGVQKVKQILANCWTLLEAFYHQQRFNTFEGLVLVICGRVGINLLSFRWVHVAHVQCT